MFPIFCWRATGLPCTQPAILEYLVKKKRRIAGGRKGAIAGTERETDPSKTADGGGKRKKTHARGNEVERDDVLLQKILCKELRRMKALQFMETYFPEEDKNIRKQTHNGKELMDT